MGWFLVSIVLPLVAPLGAMWVFRRLPLPVPAVQKSLLAPIKDGQLCWGAIAFCALALYEIAVPGADGALVSETVRGYANAGFILLMFPSAFIAAGGAIFPISIVVPVPKPWYRHYQAMATSLVLTIVAGGGYTVVHYGLLKP